MEFWNKIILEKSWEVLQKISKEFDFILIGGFFDVINGIWGDFLAFKMHKAISEDIITEIIT